MKKLALLCLILIPVLNYSSEETLVNSKNAMLTQTEACLERSACIKNSVLCMAAFGGVAYGASMIGQHVFEQFNPEFIAAGSLITATSLGLVYYTGKKIDTFYFKMRADAPESERCRFMRRFGSAIGAAGVGFGVPITQEFYSCNHREEHCAVGYDAEKYGVMPLIWGGLVWTLCQAHLSYETGVSFSQSYDQESEYTLLNSELDVVDEDELVGEAA